MCFDQTNLPYISAYAGKKETEDQQTADAILSINYRDKVVDIIDIENILLQISKIFCYKY